MYRLAWMPFPVGMRTYITDMSIDSEVLLKMSIRRIIFWPKCNLVYKVLSTSGYTICKCVV